MGCSFSVSCLSGSFFLTLNVYVLIRPPDSGIITKSAFDYGLTSRGESSLLPSRSIDVVPLIRYCTSLDRNTNN